MFILSSMFSIFFFNDTATTEIYTLSLHDALPIYSSAASDRCHLCRAHEFSAWVNSCLGIAHPGSKFFLVYDASDRKSTRLNSSHQIISYAVFCLKKKSSSILVTLFLRDNSSHANA